MYRAYFPLMALGQFADRIASPLGERPAR
jgi:hypothetical protein